MFHKARIRLTAWYLLIIMLVSLMFSSIIYKAATFELTRFEQRHRMRMEQRIQNLPRLRLNLEGETINPPIAPLPPPQDLIDEVKSRIIWLLFVLNSGILVVAGFLGYLLAGRTLKPIQKMVDEQNRFISDASHELKTPLTSLKTAMEVHLRDKNPAKNDTKILLEESIMEVDRLQALSDSLLQLAQYQAFPSHMSVEDVDITEVVDKSIQKLKPMAEEKNITIKKEIEEVVLKGNASGIMDLFIILLDNAIKYSPVKSKIHIIAKREDGHVSISLKDEGEGIAEKDIPYIFDRFYRADSARTKKTVGGYGLGLSIAKKIVEAHKGRIEVAADGGKGSVFTVKLPIK